MLDRVEPLPHDVELQGLVGHVPQEAVVVEGRPEVVGSLQKGIIVLVYDLSFPCPDFLTWSYGHNSLLAAARLTIAVRISPVSVTSLYFLHGFTSLL